MARMKLGGLVVTALALFLAGAVVIGLIALGGCGGSGNETASPKKAPAPVHLQMGQQAALSSAAQDDGIVSVTVYSLQLPFTSVTDNQPDSGDGL